MGNIEVILNSPVYKLGKIGDLVKVKAGFGRNFLFPRDMAVTANKENKKRFEEMKSQLLKEHEQKIFAAKKMKKECDGQWLNVIKSSNYDGSLYGSISAQDVFTELKKFFPEIDKSIIKVSQIIRKIGIYDLKIFPYDDIVFAVKLNIAGSIGEAEQNKKTYIEDQMNRDTEQKAQITREKFDNKRLQNKKDNDKRES